MNFFSVRLCSKIGLILESSGQDFLFLVINLFSFFVQTLVFQFPLFIEEKPIIMIPFVVFLYPPTSSFFSVHSPAALTLLGTICKIFTAECKKNRNT